MVGTVGIIGGIIDTVSDQVHRKNLIVIIAVFIVAVGVLRKGLLVDE